MKSIFALFFLWAVCPVINSNVGYNTERDFAPIDFADFVREETKLWTQVIRASGAKFD